MKSDWLTIKEKTSAWMQVAEVFDATNSFKSLAQLNTAFVYSKRKLKKDNADDKIASQPAKEDSQIISVIDPNIIPTLDMSSEKETCSKGISPVPKTTNSNRRMFKRC